MLTIKYHNTNYNTTSHKQTEAKPNIQDNNSYVDYQTSMVELAKKIAYLSQEMVIGEGEFIRNTAKI